MKGSNLLEAARDFVKDERGLTSVEYAILLGLFLAGMVAAWQSFGEVLGDSIKINTDAVANVNTR